MSVSDFNVELSYNDSQKTQDPTSGLWKFRLPYPTSSGTDWSYSDIVCEIWSPTSSPRTIGSTSSEMVRSGNYLDIYPTGYDGTTNGWKITLFRRVAPTQGFSPSSMVNYDLSAMISQLDKTVRLAQEAFAMARRSIQVHPSAISPSSGYDAPAVYFDQITGLSTMTVYSSPSWNSTNSYNAGDVVNYGGAIFISLTSANSNNVPSASPAFWNNVTQKLNQWSSTATYALNDIALYSDGNFYISLQSNNSNNLPSSQSTWWLKINRATPTWDSATTYSANEVVNYSGALYASVAGSNLNNTPGSSSTYWKNISSVFPAWQSGYTYSANDFIVYSGKLYYSLQSANTNQTPGVAGSTWWREYSSGSSGSGGAYYYDNAESGGVGSYSGFNDGAVSTPVDGTGGSMSGLTISSNSTTPLNGSSDYKIAKATGNYQGNGYSTATTSFQIPRGASGETLQLKMRYKTEDVSGTAYADGDFGVWLYDVTNSILVPMSSNSIRRSANPDWFIGTFTPTGGSQYRIIIMVSSTTTGVFNLYFDDVQIGSQIQYAGSAISDWQDYTITPTGATSGPTPGTVYINKAQWRRVGSNLEVRWIYDSLGGTTGTGAYYYLNGIIPSGLSIDFTKLAQGYGSTDYWSLPGSYTIRNVASGSPTKIHVGSPLYINASGGRVALAHITYNGSAAAADLWGPGSAIDFSAGVAMHIQFTMSIPIAGWSTNVNLATDFTEYASNSSTTDANDTTSFVNGPDGSAGLLGNTALTANRVKRVRFNRPIQPTDRIEIEYYDFTSGKWIAGGAQINGVPIPNGYTNNGTNAAGAVLSAVSGSNTDIDVNFYRYANPVTPTAWGNASLVGAKWRVRKISNGNMAEQPPVVRAEYTGTQTLTSATAAILNASTLVEDPFACVTTGASWVFTCKIPGLYRVTINPVVLVNPATATTVQVWLKKNSLSTTYSSATDKYIGSYYHNTGVNCGPSGSEEIRLVSGDYITLIGNSTAATLTSSQFRITITRIGS